MSNVAAAEAEPTEESGDVSNQYVTFNLNQEYFAIPMATVLEIIRVPEVVEVPLTPSSLVGLANLRGRVLPVLDLRRVLGLESREYCEATRVVVVDSGMPIGLVVDRVSRVMSVESSAIESTERARGSIDSKLLGGVAKNVGGVDLIQLLDVHEAIRREFAAVLEMVSDQDGVETTSHMSPPAAEAEGEDDDEDMSQLVSFVVNEQEYALDISEVEEIVRVPESVSHVPRSRDHVLGLINLRGQLLPLVSLRRMFELGDGELDDQKRILVVTLDRHNAQGETVGIVVDQVREVLRVSNQVQERMPGLLRKSGELEEIGAVCRLENGERLVSVLSAGALFQHPAVKEAIEARDNEKAEGKVEQEDLVGEESRAEDDETQLVVFQLAGQEFGVGIDAVQEITRVPDEMTGVPHTAEFIDGIVNLRGSVLPVLDMRSRFGLDRMDRNDRQRILVLDIEGMRTGFITDAVQEVLRLSKSLIEDAPSLSPEQSRVMGRVVNFKERKRMIQILDVGELLAEQEVKALLEAS